MRLFTLLRFLSLLIDCLSANQQQLVYHQWTLSCLSRRVLSPGITIQLIENSRYSSAKLGNHNSQ
jgi:hypothetical protein